MNVIEKTIDKYIKSIEPCDMCGEKENETYSENCYECCFYYGSNFHLKKELLQELKKISSMQHACDSCSNEICMDRDIVKPLKMGFCKGYVEKK